MDTVLITGTTSGIGKAFVEKFASMGNNIILVSKNRDKLHHQQIDLQSRYQVSVKYISCDLAKSAVGDCLLMFLSTTLASMKRDVLQILISQKNLI